MTTKSQSATEPPDRIWIQPAGLSFFYANSNGTYYSTPDIESIEYARVDRKYFCSCGAALTAEEYITHYFELGHDRGNPASAAPVGDNQPHCWHCGDVLEETELKLRCEQCPADCDDELCNAFGCAPSAAATAAEQTVYVSEHPVTLHCNTCGLVQVRSFKCPCGDGQLVVGAAPVEQSESQ